jgi:MarR family transcriptional repressor of emrRAB
MQHTYIFGEEANLCNMHTRQRQANLLGALSTTVADRIRAAVATSAPSSGEGPSGLVALATFMNGGSIEELSRVLGLSHSATVRLVDKLEQADLVSRRSGKDARTISLVPTSRGKAVGAQIQRARQEALNELLDPLSAGERAELARLHEKLLTGVVAAGESRGRICRLCDAEACGHERGRCPVTEAREPGAAVQSA